MRILIEACGMLSHSSTRAVRNPERPKSRELGMAFYCPNIKVGLCTDDTAQAQAVFQLAIPL